MRCHLLLLLTHPFVLIPGHTTTSEIYSTEVPIQHMQLHHMAFQRADDQQLAT